MPSDYKFLHELVEQQKRNQIISEMLESFESDPDPDPWRYSEPPAPFVLDNNNANI
jgi:hypothetical protein